MFRIAGDYVYTTQRNERHNHVNQRLARPAQLSCDTSLLSHDAYSVQRLNGVSKKSVASLKKFGIEPGGQEFWNNIFVFFVNSLFLPATGFSM